MSPLISTEWDLMIVGAAFTMLVLGFVLAWALCVAAARADRAMERSVREDLMRSRS
jgi:hypothetical protein